MAVLVDLVKRLGPSQRHATTAEVWARWLEPPTRGSRCRCARGIVDPSPN